MPSVRQAIVPLPPIPQMKTPGRMGRLSPEAGLKLSFVLLLAGTAVVAALMVPRAAALCRPSGTPFAPPASGPLPLLVYTQHDPWRMVIGSAEPLFALYEDGTVIYAEETDPGRMPRFASHRLTRAGRDSLLARLQPDSIARMAPCSAVSTWTDQPDNVLVTWQSGTMRVRTLYGFLGRTNTQGRRRAPGAFVRAYDVAVDYRHPQAVRWYPEKVEVLVWPYEYSPDRPLAWPAGWPGLDGPGARLLRDSLYSIPLDPGEAGRLDALVRSLGPRQAVLVGGRKWALAYRFPFPNEHLWRGARRNRD